MKGTTELYIIGLIHSRKPFITEIWSSDNWLKWSWLWTEPQMCDGWHRAVSRATFSSPSTPRDKTLQEAKPNYFHSHVQSHWTQKRHLSGKSRMWFWLKPSNYFKTDCYKQTFSASMTECMQVITMCQIHAEGPTAGKWGQQKTYSTLNKSVMPICN